MDDPPSLLKRLLLEWWLLHSSPACPPVHPEGEIREEETTRGPCRSLGKSHPIWLVWQLLSLASVWIVNPLLRVEVGKQALKTSALVGGVWCLMNYSAQTAKHKAFQKERRFQYRSLRPPTLPRRKASRMVLPNVENWYLLPDALSISPVYCVYNCISSEHNWFTENESALDSGGISAQAFP